MRRVSYIGIAAGLLFGAVAALAYSSQSYIAPTGPYEVTTGNISLNTRRGTFPIRLWSPIASATPSPLIIYAPGWGNKADDSASLMRELASHGYVIAAYDDLIHDDGIGTESRQSFEDRHGKVGFDDPAAYDASAKLAGRRVANAADKGEAILDALLADPELSASIDADRIASVGYSFGGATGVEQALSDRRIRAVVNLDGWLFGVSQSMPEIPYLLISVPENFPPISWATEVEPWKVAAYKGALHDQTLHSKLLGKDSFVWLKAEGVTHADLNDQSLKCTWIKRLLEKDACNLAILQFKSAQFSTIRMFLDNSLKTEGNPDFVWERSLPEGLSPVRRVNLLL